VRPSVSARCRASAGVKVTSSPTASSNKSNPSDLAVSSKPSWSSDHAQ
jgi:hypothetical protein